MTTSVSRHERFFIREKHVFEVVSSSHVTHETDHTRSGDGATERVIATCSDYGTARDIERSAANRATSDLHALDKSRNNAAASAERAFAHSRPETAGERDYARSGITAAHASLNATSDIRRGD